MFRFVLLLLVLPIGACDVFRGGDPRPKASLSEAEFVEVYVALSRATQPEEKARILKQHNTSEKELQEFVRLYTRNLPALAEVFDSVVARLGVQPERRFRDVPGLPMR
jgi:hypothetical protein